MIRFRTGLTETILLIGGLVLASALLLKLHLSGLALTVCAVVVTYAGLVFATSIGDRLRLLANGLALCLLYGASGTIVQALAIPSHESQLLAADRWLFGQTPAIAAQNWMTTAGSPFGDGHVRAAILNDVLSFGYLSYHVYLAWFVVDALLRNSCRRIAVSRLLLGAISIGCCGYFVFPAADPHFAFPDLFPNPLAGNGPTQLLVRLVDWLASRSDAFPSVHVLATTVMLTVDFRMFRIRAAVMILPSLIMLAATVVLRLHYAVDVIAGFVIASGFLWANRDFLRLVAESPSPAEHRQTQPS